MVGLGIYGVAAVPTKMIIAGERVVGNQGTVDIWIIK
jgi:hypothetical protein